MYVYINIYIFVIIEGKFAKSANGKGTTEAKLKASTINCDGSATRLSITNDTIEDETAQCGG